MSALAFANDEEAWAWIIADLEKVKKSGKGNEAQALRLCVTYDWQVKEVKALYHDAEKEWLIEKATREAEEQKVIKPNRPNISYRVQPVRGWDEVVVPEGASELDRLTYVPGIVGDITEWNWSTARRQNRMLSFGTSVAVVGTLQAKFGVVGPENNSTHLFIMNVAPSSFGKDHPLSGGEDVIRSIGMEIVLGPTTFGSAPGFLKDLAGNPVQILLMDEIGDQWKLISAQGQNAYVSAIFGELKKAYNSFKVIRTAAVVDRPSVEIKYPAVTIVGASTPEKYWVGLTPAEFDDGFVNRILLLPTGGKRPPERLIPREALVVPEAIKSTLRNDLGFDLKKLPAKEGERLIQTDLVKWGKDAPDVYLAYSREIDDLEEGGRPGEFNLAKRGAENAVRLATIIARGRGSKFVEVADIERGIAIAKQSVTTSLGGKDEFVKTYLQFDQMCAVLEAAYRQRGWISNRDAAREWGRIGAWVGVFDKAHAHLIKEERIKFKMKGKAIGYEWNPDK